jgi:hypothetical protein
MMYPLVQELAAEKIPVAVTCRVLGFTKQAFYKWCANPVSQRDWDDAHLINAAYDIHADDPAFGYRFIADELRERGLAVGENRVSRLCSQQRIWSIFAKKRGLVGSMGRVGACGDNAAMESFFALLQQNVLDRQRWNTREELRLAIITWIERTYHRRRRQRRLGRLTPVEYETLNPAATAA